MPVPVLRPYQDEGVAEIRAAFADGNRAVLFVLPTGGGKTVVFSYIAHGAAAKDNAVIIVVHREELLAQASANLHGIGVRHGIIAPAHAHTRDIIQVASVNTLVNRIKSPRKPRPPALVVFDEGHHATAGMWSQIEAAYPEAKILGVTATPCRADGRGLGSVYNTMVVGPSIAELIDQGFLVQPIVFAPPSADLSKVHTRGGDFAKDEAAEAVDKPKITGDAVAHYRRLCDGQPAIAFCASIAHAEHVASTFRSQGYRAQSVDGNMDPVARRQAIQQLATGQLNVMTSCDLISEGTDVPVVAAAILLRPTKSTGLFLQQVGRALRPVYAPGYNLDTLAGRAAAIAGGGKRAAYVLDHVGNCLRHGLPDDPREWSLAGGALRAKKDADEAKGPITRQCPQCYRMHRPQPLCPHCKYVYPGAMPEQVEGELQQVTREDAQRRQRQEIMDLQRALAESNDRGSVERIAEERGYKPGWVDYIMKSRGAARDAGRAVPAVNPFGKIKEWKGET